MGKPKTFKPHLQDHDLSNLKKCYQTHTPSHSNCSQCVYLQQRVVQRDFELCQPGGWVLALLLDLQILPGHRLPAPAMRRQLVHQLVLAGQRQAEAGLAPVREAQLPSLAGEAMRPTSSPCVGPQGQQALPEKAVEQLVAGWTVLAQQEDVGRAGHHTVQVFFLLPWERDAVELYACIERGGGGRGRGKGESSVTLTWYGNKAGKSLAWLGLYVFRK